MNGWVNIVYVYNGLKVVEMKLLNLKVNGCSWE